MSFTDQKPYVQVEITISDPNDGTQVTRCGMYHAADHLMLVQGRKGGAGMRIAISERGVLRIERAGKMKDQFCPYSTTPDDFWSRCGDWCPLFREPIFEDNDRSQPWLLQICDASFFGEEEDFEDQRKKIGEDAK